MVARSCCVICKWSTCWVLLWRRVPACYIALCVPYGDIRAVYDTLILIVCIRRVILNLAPIYPLRIVYAVTQGSLLKWYQRVAVPDHSQIQ